MTAWDDYQSAARQLDAARRGTASDQPTALQAATADLAMVRQRLALQASRLTDLAIRAGLPPPALAPDTAVPDPPDPAAASALLRTAAGELDDADAALSEVDGEAAAQGPFPDLPQTVRNLMVYGGVAVVVLVTQLVLFFVAAGPAASFGALACGAALPAFGYAVSWVSIGLLFGRVDRNPVIGAVVSAAPVALLCGGIAVTALLR